MPRARRGWRRAGALRIGAGLASVAAEGDAVAINAAQLTAIMVKPFKGAKGLAELLSDRRFNAIILGPGLGVGAETRALVAAVLASGAGAVLDADALTAFQEEAQSLFAKIGHPAVMTPHAGEFERLFPGLLKSSGSKVEAARAAAARANAVVLLKGGDTVIAAPRWPRRDQRQCARDLGDGGGGGRAGRLHRRAFGPGHAAL